MPIVVSRLGHGRDNQRIVLALRMTPCAGNSLEKAKEIRDRPHYTLVSVAN